MFKGHLKWQRPDSVGAADSLELRGGSIVTGKMTVTPTGSLMIKRPNRNKQNRVMRLSGLNLFMGRKGMRLKPNSMPKLPQKKEAPFSTHPPLHLANLSPVEEANGLKRLFPLFHNQFYARALYDVPPRCY